MKNRKGRWWLLPSLVGFMVVCVVLWGILQYGNPQWCRIIFLYQASKSGDGNFWITPPGEYTGKWIAWHLNGKRKVEFNMQDGRIEGAWVCWDKYGNKKLTVEFRNGVKHGTSTWFDDDGAVTHTEEWRNAKKIGDQWNSITTE